MRIIKSFSIDHRCDSSVYSAVQGMSDNAMLLPGGSTCSSTGCCSSCSCGALNVDSSEKA